MSEISLFEFENQQTENLFSCKNYILRNSRHEKTVLENSAGERLVRHFMYKPADISVYKVLTEISNPFLCQIYEISEDEKGFAAPEQYGFHQSDRRADLYSLSVLLNYILTGEHPSVKMCGNKSVAGILKKCLAINPEDRYSSAEELYIAIKKAQRRSRNEKMS